MHNTVAALALAGCLFVRDATACAPAPRQGERVNVAEESAVIVWDPATRTEHFIRRATFSGEARDFGFLVPTPTVPVLARVDDDVFDRMQEKTRRATVHEVVKTIDWTPLILAPFTSRNKGEGTTAGRAPVEVLSTQTVAGYEAAILDATDAEALSRWLAGNGYATTPDLTEWLETYVTKRWIVSAFKIDKSADAITARTSAVRMSFATDLPFFPYHEPASQRDETGSTRVLRVWFIGPERVTGRVGDQTWPGQMYWSAPFQDLQVGGVSVMPGARLTAFEDHSSPRPSVADLYFERNADQREVVPPPLVETTVEATHIPADVVLAAVAGATFFWRRRRKAPVS